MPMSETAKAQKRLRKVEQAHARLAELAKRIDAQAAAIADLVAQASRPAGANATARATRKPAATTRRPVSKARKRAATARKPAAAARKPAPSARA